ncbi:MAG: FliO/MopB family protein [Candidatus Hydrogenedentes bacterium]|nr:FliO/MopB family protein [Candidatus Hydrogenedentota bacterium]
MCRCSAIVAIALAIAFSTSAAEQKAAPEFEAVAPPQVILQPPNLDKSTPADEEPVSPTPPASDSAADSAVSAEDWAKIQAEIDKGSDTTDQAAEQPATAAAPVQAPGTGASLLRGTLALCVVLALILVCYYVANRYGKKSPLFAGTTLGKILGRVHLSPKAELYFVKVKDRVLVIGVTQNEISRVAEFDAALFDDAQTAAAPVQQHPAPRQVTFANELRAQSLPEATPSAVSEELAALRAELDKARQYFRETSGEPGAL